MQRDMKLDAPAVAQTTPLRREAVKGNHAVCTLCGSECWSTPERTVDPRWVFAKCHTCGKRVIARWEPRL